MRRQKTRNENYLKNCIDVRKEKCKFHVYCNIIAIMIQFAINIAIIGVLAINYCNKILQLIAIAINCTEPLAVGHTAVSTSLWPLYPSILSAIALTVPPGLRPHFGRCTHGCGPDRDHLLPDIGSLGTVCTVLDGRKQRTVVQAMSHRTR